VASIDDIRERLSIEDVVGDQVQLKRAGSTYKGLCPFHNEKTPSFIVTPSRGTYKCFSCGQHGDIFSFVMETKHVGFLDAAQLLAGKAGVTLDKPDQDSPENKLKDRVYEMNAAAAVYFQQMLAAPPGTPARAYLTRRAIIQKTTEDFALGYAPGHGELCKRLRDAGYSDEEMVDGGLAVAPEGGGPMRDRFYGRLIFPIRDAKGHIQGFGGRVLDDGQPKYLNSPATSVFDKSRVLYAIEHAADAIRSAREVVVVEGYMDALRAHQEGFANVVATLGTAITEQNLRALARYAPRLVLALDADPAGQRAAIKGGLIALKALPKTTASGTKREPTDIYVAALPEGQDPDDAIAADPAVWRAAIAGAAPLMDHYVALVTSGLDRGKPTWRQEAIDTLVPAIGDLDGVGLQQTYIARLSDLTGVDARYLRDEVTRVSGVPSQTLAGRRVDSGRRRERTVAAPPPAPDTVDPIRTTEEYLVGLLLLHRPLPSEVRATLETYTPGDIELAALLSALLDGYAPDPAREELAERLAALAGKRPPVSPGNLLPQVHDLVTRVAAERSRRELLDLGEALREVDRETAREMDGRVLKVMALKEQAEVRYQREQIRRRRQPAIVGEEL